LLIRGFALAVKSGGTLIILGLFSLPELLVCPKARSKHH